jgi:hypothetical protein
VKFDDPIIAGYLLGRRAISRIQFPGLPNVEIGVRVLTGEEIDQCRLAAAGYMKKRRADLALDPDFFDRALQAELVASAFLDVDSHPDSPDVFFSSSDQVRKLDQAIQHTLFSAYLQHQDEISPLRRLNEDEIRELVNALGEGRSAEAILNACDAATLRVLLRSLASALQETRQTNK